VAQWLLPELQFSQAFCERRPRQLAASFISDQCAISVSGTFASFVALHKSIDMGFWTLTAVQNTIKRPRIQIAKREIPFKKRSPSAKTMRNIYGYADLQNCKTKIAPRYSSVASLSLYRAAWPSYIFVMF
jgi:hypothetical protein